MLILELGTSVTQELSGTFLGHRSNVTYWKWRGHIQNPSMSLREWGKLMIIFNREAMWSSQGHGNTCARKFQLNHLFCSFQSYVFSCEPEVWIARPPCPGRTLASHVPEPRAEGVHSHLKGTESWLWGLLQPSTRQTSSVRHLFTFLHKKHDSRTSKTQGQVGDQAKVCESGQQHPKPVSDTGASKGKANWRTKCNTIDKALAVFYIMKS